MSPQARKAKSESILQKEGIPFLQSLPCVEPEEETKLRSSEEVGIRIACLFCVVGSAFEAGDTVFKDHLRTHQLWEHLTPRETAFLTQDTPERQSRIDFTWRSEALFVLMWGARLFEALPLPRQQTDTGEIISRVPRVEESPWAFIRGLRLRPKAEVLNASDLIYRLHWATRQASIDGMTPPAGLIPSVVQEWHHAINWLTRYEDQDWDEVSTDT